MLKATPVLLVTVQPAEQQSTAQRQLRSNAQHCQLRSNAQQRQLRSNAQQYQLLFTFVTMKITLIAGARPNFMKIAPIIRAIEMAKKDGANIDYRLVHTGQHYDKAMSGSFFEQLNIPEPHVNLECGGGSQAEQTAAIMVAFEKELIANPCNYVVVVGDVTPDAAVAYEVLCRRHHMRQVTARASRAAHTSSIPLPFKE